MTTLTLALDSTRQAPALRPYQREALDRVMEARGRGVLRQLGVASTGLGKTVIFASLAREMNLSTLILAHRDELIEQAVDKLRVWWPGVDVGVVKGARQEWRHQVVVASVQSLHARRLAHVPVDLFGLVIVDEVHHARAQSYEQILDHFRCGPNVHSDAGPLLLGVTATPDRGDGKGLDRVCEEIVFNYDILWGIRSGFLSDLRGVQVVMADLDLSKVKVTAGDYNEGQLGDAMEAAGAPEHVVAAWLEHAITRRTLVFMPTVDLAVETADEFIASGVKAGWVSGALPLDQRRDVLRRFSTGEIQVLTNCMVATEGYDNPAVDCVVIGRPTKSRALYCFDAATEVLTPDGWVAGRTVREGATIAAFDPADGGVRWEPVLATIERPLLPGEQMMALRSPSIDLRVTDSHRMVWRQRIGRDRHRSPWSVTTAGELAQRSDVWELPVAGTEKAPGLPLTDAEVAFIAWVQTDGTVNKANGGITISQQYPEQCGHIEATLAACGFKWRVGETSDATPYGPRRFPCRRYRISRGVPRGEDKHLRGWGSLAPWLPKAVGAAAWKRLEDLDEAQWAVFLDAWHRGDGSKQAGQTWTRRSYHLAVADEWVAGWLQGMCMRRGWRANVARSDAVWMVHCRRGDARYVGGAASKDRPRLLPDESPAGEQVWCLSVPSGAILVRRNGKGAVCGQTQMVGRGTRKFPGKADCLVLDVVGAANEHDLASIPSLFGIEKKEGFFGGEVTVLEAMDEQEEQQRRAGVLIAREVELFHRLREKNQVTWVKAGSGSFAANAGDDTVVLVPGTVEDSWTVRVLARNVAPRTLMADVDLELAQGVGDDHVRRSKSAILADPNAAWRKRKPSANHIAAAKKWKIEYQKGMTAGQLSEAMDAAGARARLRDYERAVKSAAVAPISSPTIEPF